MAILLSLVDKARLELAKPAATCLPVGIVEAGPKPQKPSMDEQYYQRAGCELFYRRWPGGDSAPTLVMFHGLASNSTRWRECADALAGERPWEILCPDLRGHGRSVYRGRLGSEDWMADLLALLDEAGCDRAFVGGHCLGANLALRFAVAHPERVRGLVLVEPMLPGALRGTTAVARRIRWLLPLLALPVRGLNRLGIYRRSLRPLDLTELDRATRSAMAQEGGHQAMLKRYASPGQEFAYMPVASYLQSLNQVLRPIAGLAKIGCPALALLSEGGLLADPKRSRALLSRMPDIRIRQLSALHWIPTEQPEAMTKAIRDFLDTNRHAGLESNFDNNNDDINHKTP